jgi:hypothetical protein
MNDTSDTLSASKGRPAQAFGGLNTLQKLLRRLEFLVSMQAADSRENPWPRILKAAQAVASTLAHLAVSVVLTEHKDFDSGQLLERTAVEKLREEFAELRSQLPHFGDTLFGLEDLDELLKRSMADRDAVGDLGQFLGWGGGLLEGFLWAIIEVAMDPTTTNPAVNAVVELCESVEKFIDGVADRWLSNTVFRGES